MRYIGSKRRLSKYIVPIIQSYIDITGFTTYVEPFCGGCNIIDKIKCDTRIACDNSRYLIELLKNRFAVRFLPDECSKEHYYDVKESYSVKDGRYPDWYIGAIGFLSSYGGGFFDNGYAGSSGGRNYFLEMKNNFIKQSNSIDGVEFICGDYRSTCANIENSVIYCDPPYYSTKKYASCKTFNHDEFWDWCREMSKRNVVLISEQAGRDDFKCIFEAPIKMTVGKNTENAYKESVEKLFIYKGGQNGQKS